MEKVYGAVERFDGIEQIGKVTFEVFYGFGEDESGTYQWRQTMTCKPTLHFVKEMVLNQINANTEDRIVSGFRWNDMPVWLGEANQLNYARDFEVALMLERDGEEFALPTYKFGTDETPIYYTFETFEEFKAFTAAWSRHISDALSSGWREKAAIDWDKYNPANARHL